MSKLINPTLFKIRLFHNYFKFLKQRNQSNELVLESNRESRYSNIITRLNLFNYKLTDIGYFVLLLCLISTFYINK